MLTETNGAGAPFPHCCTAHGASGGPRAGPEQLIYAGLAHLCGLPYERPVLHHRSSSALPTDGRRGRDTATRRDVRATYPNKHHPGERGIPPALLHWWDRVDSAWYGTPRSSRPPSLACSLGGVITNTVQDRGARCQSSVVPPLPYSAFIEFAERVFSVCTYDRLS